MCLLAVVSSLFSFFQIHMLKYSSILSLSLL